MATEKYAVINESTPGDRTIVAAVTGKRIRVLHYLFIVGGALTLTWKSGSSAISGPMAYTPAGSGAAPGCPSGVLQTAAGEALVLNLGGAVQVSGHLTYVELDP